ncbi:acyl-CoA thioesterase [Novosphingobium malaysiense]|uniref:Thioesterase n=1 Tax=Novosphingobium malaysiense TaxID=1348853 RepID=A0A0B1ZIG8_9SPHN|nr:thioesterase family protein [Novosphingobium malaysiense]KHK90322.1 thioesterase [Novosphingobium malaysiense]
MSCDSGNAPTGKQRDQRSDYVRFHPILTRWMDNDVYGHVNNVVYYSYFDTAVNAALIAEGLLDPLNSESICLVVETGCRYFEALSFPEEIEAGIRVERLGNSSVRYGIGLFRKGEDIAAAEGHFVHVSVNRDTRRPSPFSPEWRSFLSSLEKSPEA